MQMQNHAKNKLNWNGCLTTKFFTNIISKFQFQAEVDVFASRLNAQLPVYHPDLEAMHIIIFQYYGVLDPFMHFLPLL